jgi:hypothetical protein
MDREPFATWDIFADEPPPFDVLTILSRSKFNPELIRAYAQRQREKNLLVGELTRLLEPASEFTKLAIANIETRNLTQVVVESWKPIVASALNEWSRQRMLTAALSAPPTASPQDTKNAPNNAKIETTQEELDSFATVKRLLGQDRPISYEDSIAYFKIHVADRRTWVVTRLQVDRKHPLVWVPLSPEKTAEHAGNRQITANGGWSVVTLDSIESLRDLGSLFVSAHDSVKASREAGAHHEVDA